MGGGWQALVAYINLGSYYIFGLPLGFILGYVAKLGAKVKLSLLSVSLASLFDMLILGTQSSPGNH